ncbi:armadillo-type protein [Pisolithus marmoratus]|nr:armadillo-type protein [Pisolithus marmoratus]
MTPILRNRHEKVQEAPINLIGCITDHGAEFVPAPEWMRICFELLDLLKAHKKAIRRAAINSFGYIAKSLGPQDVLSVLLTNLRVQERQSCVCSTVAIAIVAETCGYSVVTMLEDALTDRDLVHRQTASVIVKYLVFGCTGLSCDTMLHLMNLVLPNCFETSPHVIGAVMDPVETMRVVLGPGVLPVTPCKVYWRVYNSLYLGAADALVPFYPDLSELSEGQNVYVCNPATFLARQHPMDSS